MTFDGLPFQFGLRGALRQGQRFAQETRVASVNQVTPPMDSAKGRSGAGKQSRQDLAQRPVVAMTIGRVGRDHVSWRPVQSQVAELSQRPRELRMQKVGK